MQYEIGAAYRNGEGVVKDIGLAAQWFRKAADRGYAPAQLTLGHMCETGEGVGKDVDAAVAWYQRAAQH